VVPPAPGVGRADARDDDGDPGQAAKRPSDEVGLEAVDLHEVETPAAEEAEETERSGDVSEALPADLEGGDVARPGLAE
jgi:hypothetical protein